MLAAIPASLQVQRFIVRSEHFNPSGETEVRLLKIEGESVVYSSMKTFSVFKVTHSGARLAMKLQETHTRKKC